MDKSRFSVDYLAFSRKERLALYSLLFIILILYLIPFFYSRFFSTQSALTMRILEMADTIQFAAAPPTDAREEEQSANYFPAETQKGTLFDFDPNTLDVEGWIRLGLSAKTAATIEKYRSKGGRFYEKEDLQKIWGLPHGFYERVKEHILITTVNKERFDPYPDHLFEKKERPSIIDINEADSIQLEALPWIGAKLAGRILVFRKKLGGFYSVDQVGETYGLPDSNFQKIRSLLKVDAALVKKMQLNTATKEELKMHPYLRWNIANAIVEYRNQHGNFTSVNELKKIAIVSDSVFEKIRHYFDVTQ
jgi:competence ComEA-like helix-hairpin-helix protein